MKAADLNVSAELYPASIDSIQILYASSFQNYYWDVSINIKDLKTTSKKKMITYNYYSMWPLTTWSTFDVKTDH